LIGADGDADPSRGQHRHRWAVGSVENSSAGPLANSVELAPVVEAEDLVVAEREQSIERGRARLHRRLAAASLLVLARGEGCHVRPPYRAERGTK